MTSDQCFSYRFGFNGQEQDNEVSGQGNSYTAEFWQYDSRLGRRFNVDPVVKVHESPYACFANNPIWVIDPNGADSLFYNDDNTLFDDTKTDGPTNYHFKLDANGSVNSYGTSWRQVEEVELYPVPTNYTNYTMDDINRAKEGNKDVNSVTSLLSVTSDLAEGLSRKIYNPSTKMWLAENGKRYYNAGSKGYLGGSGTGSMKKTIAYSAKIKGISNFLGGLSMGLTYAEYYIASKEHIGPNMQTFLWHRYQINQGVNAGSFVNWRGAVFSFTYNSGYLLEDFCNCNFQWNPITKDFTPIEETLIKYDEMGVNLHLNYIFSID
jgi:RHS repeat-associated protein